MIRRSTEASRTQAAKTEPRQGLRSGRRAAVASSFETDSVSRTIAVWSPNGSHGRSTIASSLAHVLAAAGQQTILVDADSVSPSQHLIHGLTEVTAGILGAARLVRQERYSDDEHERLTIPVGGYRLLTGLPVVARWTELDEFGLGLLVHDLAARASNVVLDIGASIDAEIVEPSLGQRRNQASLSVLSRSDVVLVVCNADPVSVSRLVEALPELERLVAGRIIVVINRMRPDAIARDARKQLDALFDGRQIAYLANDPKACDDALREGQSVTAVRPRSEFVRGVRELASRINSSHADSPRAHQTERQG